MKAPAAVVALGGNSITREFEEGNIPQQFRNTARSLDGIMALVEAGYSLVITHGNGPQVGNALVRVEQTREVVIPLPLRIIVADLQGGMGYMIEQTLRNRLRAAGVDREVVTLLTLVAVDPRDPSLENPSKFVGPYIEPDRVAVLERERGWVIREDPGRGFRRVVPSPRPVELLEKDTIERLVGDGSIVICGGGGGVPVAVGEGGCIEGLDAVIDKDYTAVLLARAVGARRLISVTGVPRVTLNYRQPDEIPLDRLSVCEARHYLDRGQFPAGSMGPKISAAIEFIEAGGAEVVICAIEDLRDAVAGRAGTRILPD